MIENGFNKDNNFSRAKHSEPASMREINRLIVLRALVVDRLSSRPAISEHTGLSMATVSRIVNTLLAEGLVREAGPSLTGTRGCPPAILEFDGNIRYVIGVDVGESIIRFELMNFLGEKVARAESKADALLGGEITLNHIIEGLNGLIDEYDIPAEKLSCICVSIAGIVNAEGYVNVPEVNGWWKYPLYQKLKKVFDTRIIIENANNCAVLDEYRSGCAKDVESVIFIKIGAGIGGGIILNGKLLRGYNNASGEIGFMLPSKEQDMQFSKKRGVLETRVGLQRITDAIHVNVDGTVDANNNPYMLTICQKAVDGNKQYMEILEENFKYYAQAATNACAVINPEMLIIGGDMDPVADMIKDEVESYLNKYLPYPPTVMVTRFGSETSLRGACRIALETAQLEFGILTSEKAVAVY